MDIKLLPMPGIEKLEDLKKEYTQNNECKKFECVNLKDMVAEALRYAKNG